MADRIGGRCPSDVFASHGHAEKGLIPGNYFHLLDDLTTVDEEGQEFSDFNGALGERLLAAGALAADQIAGKGRVVLSSRIEIADADRRVLDSVYFAEAVAILREPIYGLVQCPQLSFTDIRFSHAYLCRGSRS